MTRNNKDEFLKHQGQFKRKNDNRTDKGQQR